MKALWTFAKIVLGVTALVAPTVIVVSFMLAPAARPLNAAARAELETEISGAFVSLPDGVTHYRWRGPEGGAPVVLIHGFMVPGFVFAELAETLAVQGFHVLTYDQFGRGLSDRPSKDYDADFLDRQLQDLLTALVPDQAVNLIGYSMGGAVATIFAARHPQKVKSLALIAPAGLSPNPGGRDGMLVRFFLAPGLGEWMVRVFGPLLAEKRAENGFARAPAPARMGRQFLQQTHYAGYYEALLSILRHYPMAGGARESFATVGRSALPVLLIWGEDDTQVPPQPAEAIHALMPQAERVTFAGFGHEITYAGVTAYAPALAAFLAQHNPPRTAPDPEPAAAPEGFSPEALSEAPALDGGE